MPLNIAIDGPSGSGKSTAAKNLAKRLSLIYIDTGALYRAIALYVIRMNKNPESCDEVIPLLGEIFLELSHQNGIQRINMNGEDVSELIRTPEVSMAASAVSAIPEVRKFLLFMQRDIAAQNDCVMDGRDIGTVILPNASVKIFLTASPETRADRRRQELLGRGIKVDFNQVLKDIIKRDENDSTRDIAPLRPAKDAVIFDNSCMGPLETLEGIINIIKDRLGDEII